jgi:hypothetical protein
MVWLALYHLVPGYIISQPVRYLFKLHWVKVYLASH